MNALAIETAGLWCMLAILSPKQAAHEADDCNSQGDLHQRPSYSNNRVVPLDENFEPKSVSWTDGIALSDGSLNLYARVHGG